MWRLTCLLSSWQRVGSGGCSPTLRVSKAPGVYGGQTDGNSEKREPLPVAPYTPKYTNTQRHASPAGCPASIGKQLLYIQLWRSHMAASFTITICPYSDFMRLHCRQFCSFQTEAQEGFWDLNATGKWKKHSWLQTICRIVRKTVLFCLILGLRSPFNQHFKWASSFLQRDYLHWPSTGKISNFWVDLFTISWKLSIN